MKLSSIYTAIVLFGVFLMGVFVGAAAILVALREHRML
jgi:hypothetical protein